MAIAPDTPTQVGSVGGRPVVDAVREATAVLARSSHERVWALTELEVAEAVRGLGHLFASVQAHLVVVVAEAKRRGLGSGEGWGAVDWAQGLAPQLSARVVQDVDVVAGVADDPRLSDVVSAAVSPAAGPDADAVPVGKAAQVVRFHRGVRGLADRAHLDEVTGLLLEGARGDVGLSERQLAAATRHAGDMLRPDRLVEHDADLRRAHRSLVKTPGPLGLSRYTLVLDEEGAAIVDAAVDALARPRPDADTGEHDQRPPAARRADALLDLVSRAVGAPAGVPRQAKTSLVVTIGLDVLAGRRRGTGITPSEDVLTPDTARRLACDAEVVPAVLGGHGEVLDQGRATRLFTRGQIRHLWLRDRGCTFPGCSKPPAWTDAHHLVHWVDGGRSDPTNAALLCRAHHTVVHRHRYAGQVVDRGSGPRVEWDLVTDSYDRGLRAPRPDTKSATAPRSHTSPSSPGSDPGPTSPGSDPDPSSPPRP